MNYQNLEFLGVKIPRNLKELMKKYVTLDTHNDLSELTRDAIREKIKRDAPHLYRQLFMEANSK